MHVILLTMFDSVRVGTHHLWILVILLIAASGADSLLCYKCNGPTTMPGRNPSTPPCSKFDVANPKYQVECPYSTFCMKHSIELELTGGKIVRGAIRDCALQKNNTQKYSHGTGWQEVHSIEDSAYTEGCHSGPHQANVQATPDQYCYCKGNLCNAAKPTHDSAMHHTDAMAVIFVFNAMKYVRSLR